METLNQYVNVKMVISVALAITLAGVITNLISR